jgi:DNA-binding transcriptional MerR regulator/quercetin dioxygenase-like cupin family protein
MMSTSFVPHVRTHAAAEPDDGHGYRIGQVARRIGVSPSALRLWERQGLVRPARSAGRYRLYSDADIARLTRVARMRHEQVNAPGIRLLLDPPATAGVTRSADRLRAMRRARGLSLREAAQAAGFSPSFVSAVERGTTGASVSALQRLTRAYDETLLGLFAAQPAAGRVVRPAERPVLHVGDGVRIEQLARGAEQLEPQLFVLAPGASSDGAYSHEGEEFLYVLAGALSLWIGDDEPSRLRSGDALTFPSSLPHRWRNDASGETRLLWINTPPTF